MSICLSCGEEYSGFGGISTANTCGTCMKRIRQKVKDYTEMHQLRIDKKEKDDIIDNRFEILDL